MDYLNIYNRIVAKAKLEGRKKLSKDRSDYIYYEAHHIIPRCMGGIGSCHQWKTHPNIVLLTAREHFLVHRLLCKVFPKNKSLVHSFWRTCNNKNDKFFKIDSKTFEEAKLLQRIEQSNRMLGENNPMKIKINKDKIKKSWTEERKKSHGLKVGGENSSSKRPEVREKLKLSSSGENNGMYGKCGINSPVSRKVSAYIYKTGEFISSFNSLKEASIFLKIPYTHIGSVCRGLRNSTSGYKFKFN